MDACDFKENVYAVNQIVDIHIRNNIAKAKLQGIVSSQISQFNCTKVFRKSLFVLYKIEFYLLLPRNVMYTFLINEGHKLLPIVI